MAGEALGAVEFASVGQGVRAADAMLKKAAVDLLLARMICPGRYLAVLSGSVADVREALAAGQAAAGESVVDWLELPNPHPDLWPALTGTTAGGRAEALGLVECFSMCAALEAADQAAKQAAVRLLEVRLAIMLAGRGVLTFTGREAAVQEAVAVASAVVSRKGLLLSAVVIPRLHPQLEQFLA